MRGNGRAGTPYYIHMRAKCAHEVRTQKKNEERRKKKRKKEKEWELQVRKINGGKIYYRQK